MKNVPIHVYPVNDDLCHRLAPDMDCWCNPRIDWFDDDGQAMESPLVVHHSADKREILENLLDTNPSLLRRH